MLSLVGGATVALLCGLANGAQDDAQVPLTSDYVCEHPPYKVHMVSSSPLVVYITDFLTDHERAYLREAT